MIADHHSYLAKYFVCFCCDPGTTGLEQELIGNGDMHHTAPDFHLHIIVAQVGKGAFEVEHQRQV